MSALFDPRALERCFEPLDRLDRRLWLPAIVNTQGHPVVRLAAVAAVTARLVEGHGPFAGGDGWPDADVAAAFGAQCARLEVAGLCLGQREIAEQVVRGLLWHMDRIVAASARLGREAALAECAREFHDDWETRCEELREVLRVFESLDGVANFARWSELRGLLRSQAWIQVVAARERIARLPRLAALIRRLGRSRPVAEDTAESSAVAVRDDAAPQWVRRVREAELPGAPLEAEGIRRSGEFERMLASEAIQLRRRRRLFAARLAEQKLLTYRHRHLWTDLTWVRAPGAAREDAPRPRPRLEAGPMVLCVDTSSSMAGAPEQIAKAIVLEAMRAAHEGRRACLLFSFSGPGDLAELDLTLRSDGLLAGARFLASSFHGGTDVCEPFERALDTLLSSQWRQADILIASDGEFGAPPALLERLDDARARFGLRVQGVLIGDRETIGMKRVCDDIFWVRDWRRHAEHTQVEPSIHASDLTARYFPGALADASTAATPEAGDAKPAHGEGNRA